MFLGHAGNGNLKRKQPSFRNLFLAAALLCGLFPAGANAGTAAPAAQPAAQSPAVTQDYSPTAPAGSGEYKSPWRTVGQQAAEQPAPDRAEEERRLLSGLFTRPFECRSEAEAAPPPEPAGEADYWRGVFASTHTDTEYYLKQAAGRGHWKAELMLINLRLRDLRGGITLGGDPEELVVKPLQALMRRNIPEAHVIMAEITEMGLAGAEADFQRALSIYRRAAELGSVEAQVYLGNAFFRQNDAKLMPMAEILFGCAMRQDSGSGAYGLGRVYVAQGRVPEAVPVFIQGGKWGNSKSLAVLAGLVGPDASFFERGQALSDCYGALSVAASLDRNDNPAARRIVFPDLEKRCPGAFVIPALRRVDPAASEADRP